MSKFCVNFQVLFGELFSIQITPDEAEETSISTSRALKVALKYKLLR